VLIFFILFKSSSLAIDWAGINEFMIFLYFFSKQIKAATEHVAAKNL
jgi:hypothetical protein